MSSKRSIFDIPNLDHHLIEYCKLGKIIYPPSDGLPGISEEKLRWFESLFYETGFHSKELKPKRLWSSSEVYLGTQMERRWFTGSYLPQSFFSYEAGESKIIRIISDYDAASANDFKP